MSGPGTSRSRITAVLRLGVAVLLAVALVVQFRVGVTRSGLTTVNFLSYFTVLSNIGAVVLLVALAVRPGRARSASWLVPRGAVTLAMVVTGLVYALLLAPIAADVDLSEPWVNRVLHVVGPLAALLDWLLDPPRIAPTRAVLGSWLVPPALYLVYSLVRGRLVGRYPYPFLDPAETGGYGGVAGYVAIVLVAVLILAVLLRAWVVRMAIVQNPGPVSSPRGS